MTYRNFISIGLLSLTLVNGSGAVAKDQAHWTVLTEHFQCLKSNLEIYQQIASNVVVIFLYACPETDLVKAMAVNAKNSVMADVKIVADTAEQPAVVISFTHDQLVCLANLPISTKGKVVHLPLNPCK